MWAPIIRWPDSRHVSERVGRIRAIGSSEETKAVQNSAAKFGGTDGIGYGVFSYGNFSGIANNPAYGYTR